MINPSFPSKYYAHDHLYSPVALFRQNGVLIERYEYDAYGKAAIMDASYGSRSVSSHGNSYLFTGRRLDILDNNSLKIMYYRNRYYSPEMGRFLQKDPLGITPKAFVPNIFNPTGQYKDGMNLYQYVASNAIIWVDPYGLDDYDSLACQEGCFKAYHNHYQKKQACQMCCIGMLSGKKGLCEKEVKKVTNYCIKLSGGKGGDETSQMLALIISFVITVFIFIVKKPSSQNGHSKGN